MRSESATERPADWVDPQEPPCSFCRCGAPAEPPVYVKPVFWQGRALHETGVWVVPGQCRSCRSSLDRIGVDADGVHAAAERRKAVEIALARAGLEPEHQHMTLDTWRAPKDFTQRAVIDSAAAGKANLFLFGPTGTGKTHLAVGILRRRIEATGASGYLRIVPELMLRLRAAVKSGDDAAIIYELTSAPAGLVLDDLGVERPSRYALEALYLIVDRWARRGRTGLIVTSNRDLKWVAKNLDERIASWLAGMRGALVVHMTGPDHRIEGAAS